METLMVIMVEPIPGRVAEMNDWYTWVHIRDVMGLHGSISVQRFERSRIQPKQEGTLVGRVWEYLALYELGDRGSCTRGHEDNLFTDRMPVSTAFDMENFYGAYFDPPEGSVPFPEDSAENPVLIVGFDLEDQSAPDQARALAERVEGLAGIHRTHFFSHAAEQMIPLPPAKKNILICHISDVSLAVAAWDRFAPTIADVVPGLRPESLFASVYSPIMRRLPASDVRSGPAEPREISRAMREALGDDVYPKMSADDPSAPPGLVG